MSKTSNSTSVSDRSPLVSIQWLKYLGIVSVVLSLYVVAQFYYHYGDNIFSKSLTIGQYIKISIYSIGSMLSEIIIPLLFFSGALVYRSVRLKGISILSALKRDMLVVVPLGITLWCYCAFFESSVKSSFYAMIFEIQELQPGEELVQNPTTYELIEMPDLNELYKKVDTLNMQIKDAEDKIRDRLNNHSLMLHYIEELKNQQRRYQDEIMLIHVTPIYISLFLLLGMLLGYLTPFHIAALTAILVVIGYVLYYGISILEISFTVDYSNKSWFAIRKIGILLLMNIVLLILARKTYKRSKKEYP